MLSKGKSKRAALIVAMLKGRDSGDDGASDSKDEASKAPSVDMGLESTADELISCIKRGDAEGAARALCDFIDQHQMEESGEAKAEADDKAEEDDEDEAY